MSTLQAVARKSLSDEVFDQLKLSIVNDTFPAGSSLPSERELAAALGVNRGAVREGLKRLQQAGLVEIRQGGPTRVRDYLDDGGLELLPSLLMDEEGNMQIHVARSILQMRQSMGPDVAAAAARKGGTPLADKLDAILHRMEPEAPIEQLQDHAFDFWGELVKGGGNIAYRLAYNTMGKTYRKIWGLLTHAMADEFRDRENLGAIAAAVRSGNAETARAHAQRHLAIGHAALNAVLDAYGDQKLPVED